MPMFVIDRYLVSNVCGITPFVCVFFLIQYFKADYEKICKRNRRIRGAEEVNTTHASQCMVCEICPKSEILTEVKIRHDGHRRQSSSAQNLSQYVNLDMWR